MTSCKSTKPYGLLSPPDHVVGFNFVCAYDRSAVCRGSASVPSTQMVDQINLNEV